MSHTLVPTASHAVLPHQALCAQAARVLRITAQEWGMAAQPGRAPAVIAVRKPSLASNCAGLLWWQVAA